MIPIVRNEIFKNFSKRLLTLFVESKKKKNILNSLYKVLSNLCLYFDP